MKRKGISPLIAAVLLIAFTMAVASIFAQWAPDLLTGIQDDASDDAESLGQCSNVLLEIENVQTSGPSAVVRQVRGDIAVGNVTVSFFSDDGSVAQTYVELGTQGQTAVTRESEQASVGSLSGNLDFIEASANECEGAPGASFNYTS